MWYIPTRSLTDCWGSKLRLNLKSRPGAVFQNTTLKVGIGQPHSAFSLPAKSEKADIAKLLLKEKAVVVTSGSSFGIEGYIRLSYANSLEMIREGVKRIADLASELNGGK